MPLDPRDILSASGRAVLHMDPSNDDGAGPGPYGRTQDGEVAWEVWVLDYGTIECLPAELR